MSDEIGDLIEKPGKMRVEWRIPGFFSLPSEVGKIFWSPVFFFAGMAWHFLIYPNGESECQAEEYVGLYLRRRSSGPPKTVTSSMGFLKANGEEEVVRSPTSDTFSGADDSWGWEKFFRRSNLLKRRDQLAAEDTLTLTCNLSAGDDNFSDASLTTRLWNLSLNLATVLSTREDADVTLKLPDGELDAHKMILKARSSVLGRMFSHDEMKECQTGEVKIEEGNKESFKVVLAYIYTGNPRGLSAGNVEDVYEISHKYDFRDLTRCCSEFMGMDLSVENICDVIRISDLYQDQKLMDGAKDYFVKHKDEIRKTDQWKALKEENLKIVYEFVEYALDKK